MSSADIISATQALVLVVLVWGYIMLEARVACCEQRIRYLLSKHPEAFEEFMLAPNGGVK